MNDKKNYKTVKISHKDSPAVNFLYNSLPGRILLRLLVREPVSRLFGVLMDCPASKIFIRNFIKQSNIDMSEYENVNYKSFNDFFTRKIRKGIKPFSDNVHDVTAPCDGKLTVYQITVDGKAFYIKNSLYTISGLLQDNTLANNFTEGICLIFRLSPEDYHRYAYIDNGKILNRKKIKGILHAVRPIAQGRYKVFMQNTREYEVIQTENFGKVVQMEVGALFVGRISNYKKNQTFKRGEEKGMFEFGGSTIVMLFQKDTISIDNIICENTRQNKETIVKMGNKIGIKKAHREETV